MNATLETTIRDIVADDFRAAAVFQRHGLDFCCQGNRTVVEACSEKGIDAASVLAEIASACETPDRTPRFAAWDVPTLIAYIVGNHHQYVRQAIPTLLTHTTKIASVHGERHPELAEIARLFAGVADEMTSHMFKEERILFPFIQALDDAARRKQPAPPSPFGTVGNPIRMMEAEHESAGDATARIHELSAGYRVPDDACATYRVTMQELQAFEADLHAHVHLENNILFPRALAIEESLASAARPEGCVDRGLTMDASAPLVFHRSAPLAPGAAAPHEAPARREKKKFARRRGDVSQQVRLGVQLVFLAISVWVGAQFYQWVRYYESGGASLRVNRPAGVEAWLPIAALMNLKTFVVARTVPDMHAAGMFMLIAFLAISWLYRKSFCSWICPIGTMSEWLWQGGEALLGRTFALPRWADVPLRSLKYVLFGLFAYVVVTMPVPDIRAFLRSPYGLVADVKMLDFFRHIGQTSATVIVLLVILSVFVKNFWCRFLCPYGAMTGLVALVSPTRIRRDPVACIDCAKCAVACPAGLPVDTLRSVRSAECNACMSCVAVCPAAGALDLKTGVAGRYAVVQPWALAAAIAIVVFGIVGYARAAGYWQTNLPDSLYFELIPRAAEFAHPR